MRKTGTNYPDLKLGNEFWKWVWVPSSWYIQALTGKISQVQTLQQNKNNFPLQKLYSSTTLTTLRHKHAYLFLTFCFFQWIRFCAFYEKIICCILSSKYKKMLLLRGRKNFKFQLMHNTCGVSWRKLGQWWPIPWLGKRERRWKH